MAGCWELAGLEELQLPNGLVCSQLSLKLCLGGGSKKIEPFVLNTVPPISHHSVLRLTIWAPIMLGSVVLLPMVFVWLLCLRNSFTGWTLKFSQTAMYYFLESESLIYILACTLICCNFLCSYIFLPHIWCKLLYEGFSLSMRGPVHMSLWPYGSPVFLVMTSTFSLTYINWTDHMHKLHSAAMALSSH